MTLTANGKSTAKLKLLKSSVDTASGSQEFAYRSYAAQLIPADIQTSETGTLMKGATLNNLPGVQSYAKDTGVVAVSPQANPAIPVITPEQDEFIAETVILSVYTGGDEQSPIMLITAITGGLVIIAVGIIIIKKFIIK